MSKIKTQSDVSNEMIIQRQGNGVVIKPPHADCESKLTLNAALALPINVFLLNLNSQHCAVNNLASNICGWTSERKALGKSVYDIWPDKMAKPLIHNDRIVVTSTKMKVIEEEVHNDKIVGLQALSFKFPWFDEDGNVVGIFGCSIVPDRYPFFSLGNSLAILAKTQLLNSTTMAVPLGAPMLSENYFTKREIDVLKLLVRAKTCKEIAAHLGLSHRTVEHYLENAKRKVGVSSKSELIDKIIDISF
jgi:DNA-binding CsgD family transcriptional regulator